MGNRDNSATVFSHFASVNTQDRIESYWIARMSRDKIGDERQTEGKLRENEMLTENRSRRDAYPEKTPSTHRYTYVQYMYKLGV